MTTEIKQGTPTTNKKGEVRYEYTCPKCWDEYWVDEKIHAWIQTLDRLPKCGPCYL